jgi:hypothetical protein
MYAYPETTLSGGAVEESKIIAPIGKGVPDNLRFSEYRLFFSKVEYSF